MAYDGEPQTEKQSELSFSLNNTSRRMSLESNRSHSMMCNYFCFLMCSIQYHCWSILGEMMEQAALVSGTGWTLHVTCVAMCISWQDMYKDHRYLVWPSGLYVIVSKRITDIYFPHPLWGDPPSQQTKSMFFYKLNKIIIIWFFFYLWCKTRCQRIKKINRDTTYCSLLQILRWFRQGIICTHKKVIYISMHVNMYLVSLLVLCVDKQVSVLVKLVSVLVVWVDNWQLIKAL